MDAVLTMCASCPCANISGTKTCIPWITPQRLTPRIQAQSASLTSQIAPLTPTPALLKSRCTPPNAAMVFSASVATSAARDTSVGTASTGVRCFQLLRGHRQRGLIHVGQHQAHALACTTFGEAPANAARRTGDDRDLIRECLHSVLTSTARRDWTEATIRLRAM